MAAAYAALVSLTHILDQILHPPPGLEITVVRNQIEFLREKVTLLLDFLENHSSRRSNEIEQKLETRIAEAAYAAEDVVESNVMNQIIAKSAIRRVKIFHSITKNLMKFKGKKGISMVLEKFISIEKEFVKIEENKDTDVLPSENSTTVNSSRPLPSSKNIVVGFDKHMIEIMGALTTNESNRQIIAIVGMGGIVSQEYTEKEILLGLLHQISNTYRNKQDLTDDILGETLHKELFGRRYLIVMDDMWGIKAWEMVNRFLPDNNSGSRILVTTRQLDLAVDLGDCSPYKLNFLNKEQSWDLLREKIFAEEDCPTELEVIGKSIAKKCRGLPLALVVIAGLLAKSKREHWKHVEEDVTSVINNQDDELCRKILSLSYSHLPIYLKPCFLYFAVFPEDYEIQVSRLIRLWVAEGFIKQDMPQSLEKIAEDHLKDLINRNLILVGKHGISGEVKTLRIHDLLRDLCRREAQKDNFLGITKLDNNPNISPYIERVRRLSIHGSAWKEMRFKASRSAAHTRSFLSYSSGNSTSYTARRFKFLRVLDVVDRYPTDEILQLINSRYVACMGQKLMLPSISRLWSLQTLVVDTDLTLPSEVWQMPQLRHLKARRVSLPDPPDSQMDGQKIVVLENLQTLSNVEGFRCTEQVIKRIPNVKKLGINCLATGGTGSFYLSNLGLLHKLESLVLEFTGTWGNMVFPGSLKKLTLSGCKISWGDMSVIGSLPNLEVLKLRTDAAIGQEWNPIEGEFTRLKFLLIHQCELEIWGADNTHFPSLEQLHLGYMSLKEIPAGFAEMLSLQVIHLNHCTSSILESAMEISEQRESLGYDCLQVRSFPPERQEHAVSFKDEAETLIKHLNEESEELEVVTIVGMDGMGKTTLARKIYRDPRIQKEFPFVIWIYISQELDRRVLFLNILKRFTEQDMSSKTDNELAQIVRSYLEKQKFLLFLDDMHSTEDWDDIKDALPTSNRLGKVLITSPLLSVATYSNRNREAHCMHFLDSKESWELLQLKVFGKLDECPPELEVLGKRIANLCEGLPLAILLIGGILFGKQSSEISAMENEWKQVLDSMSNIEEHIETCTVLSYDQLPHDLRDCFLYLGIFPEDYEIPAWKLTRLWIAEGFIQQKPEKSLEEVAEDNLKDLINRSLVMVDETNAEGNVKICRVHDIIRGFCVKEAARQNLFQEMKRYWTKLSKIRNYRRLCIRSCDVIPFLCQNPKGPMVSSFLCFSNEAITLAPQDESLVNLPLTEAFNSIRVLDVNPIKFTKFPIELTQLIHLRYIALSGDEFNALPEAISKLWNLHTIIIDTMSRTFEIKANMWKMMQLRHLKTKAAIILNNAEVEGEGGENLQTLSRLSVQCCTQDVFDRVPNLKNLGIRGHLATLLDSKCLEKLDHLQKLKLVYDVYPALESENPLRGLPDRFPPNLRTLELSATYLDWKHMSILGMLRGLEVLKLKENAFVGKYWDCFGGCFPSLEFLLIASTDLQFWTVSGDQFRRLRCLELKGCEKLEEIPFELEKSLQILNIEYSSRSALDSARKIQQERQRGKTSGFKLIVGPGNEW